MHNSHAVSHDVVMQVAALSACCSPEPRLAKSRCWC